ncbi:MAG TPA: hypothetical protein VFQ53_43715 [Kofleriaceae bacterium]|nr:hypothetical protein [Kofleriaceae bacterium]
MIVFSNRRLGPAAELLVSVDVAQSMLRAIADAARPEASARWELELVRWLEARAAATAAIDVSDLAWTPTNFDRQRDFVVAAIARAAESSEHSRALARWAAMIEAHPRDSVQFGRLWSWQPTA